MLKTELEHPSAPTPPQRHAILGIPISATDYTSVVNYAVATAQRRESAVISLFAVHAVVTSARDVALRDAVASFDIVAPDGQPVRWALNAIYGTRLDDRVYGPELMLRLCERAAQEGIAIYLYGGSPKVSQVLPERLRARYPRLHVAASESPPYRPLTDLERAELIDRINRSGAGIVFIGLGCPKQDRFAHDIRTEISAVQVCVGAAFDFHSGNKPMAPRFMQRTGLEWLYRLIQEPRRLWKRYLVTNTLFVVGVGRQWFSGLLRRSSGNRNQHA